MLETKHTDGNWKVLPDETFPTLHQIWNDSNSDDIPTYIARTCYAPKSEANAKLIAAAPELLEACQRAFQVLESENIFGQARLLLAMAIKKALS